MAEWPTSPHELLGVGHRYGARDLKKAYTKLIRYYKPELHPQEFARIRDAYDRLLPWAGAESKDQPPADELPPPRTGDEGQTEPRFNLSLHELPVPNRPPSRPDRYPSFADDGDRMWRQAADGGPEPAYRGLVEDALRRPAVDRTYLRLFWLLSVYQELDAELHPADWLARGLSACPGSQPLVEAYAMHLRVQPLEANTPRCAEVLTGLTDPHQTGFLVGHVWRAKLGLMRWQDVRDQFSAVKAKIGLVTDAWLNLVRLAADHAAWGGDLGAAALMGDCLRELEDLNFVALHKPEIFDRVDFLRSLAQSARTAKRRTGLGGLAELVRREWTADLDAVRGDLHRLVSDMSSHPNIWSNRFDVSGAEISAVVCQCYQLISQLRHETGYDAPLPDDPDFLRRVSSELAPRAYSDYREAIYEFCLATFVSPEALAALLAPRYAKKFPQSVSLEELILGDWPLRLVCLAHRFYHS